MNTLLFKDSFYKEYNTTAKKEVIKKMGIIKKLMKNFLGKVSSIKDNIVYCFSPIFDKSFIGEIAAFQGNSSTSKCSNIEDDTLGIIFEINSDIVKILLLSRNQSEIKVGMNVFCLNKTLKIKVSFDVLGKIISPFGEIYFDNKANIVLKKLFEISYKFLDYNSPSIIMRKKVSKPLLTGINSIDSLFPIGLGQRQLIIGDNNTGKTSLAISIVLNQSKYNDYSKLRYIEYARLTYFKPCIYVFIGQKRSEAIRTRQVLLSYNSL